MPYPQTRVFDPTALSSGTVALPTETPYILFDTSGVDGVVNADDIKYTTELTVIKAVGTSGPVTLECPVGWTTPAGPQTDFELPGSRAGTGAWRVLYIFPLKLIGLLSATGAAFPGGAGIPEPQLATAGVFPVGAITGAVVEFDDTAGIVHFGGAQLLEGDISFMASKISGAGVNGAVADWPGAPWLVNGLGASFVFPTSTVAQRGAWVYYTNLADRRIEVRPAV